MLFRPHDNVGFTLTALNHNEVSKCIRKGIPSLSPPEFGAWTA